MKQIISIVVLNLEDAVTDYDAAIRDMLENATWNFNEGPYVLVDRPDGDGSVDYVPQGMTLWAGAKVLKVVGIAKVNIEDPNTPIDGVLMD